MGILTDRFGGRGTFTALLVVSALARGWSPRTTPSLITAAFFIGLAGSSLQSGGVRLSLGSSGTQGTVLGVCAGTLGQSLAVFAAPVIASSWGWTTVFRGMSGVLFRVTPCSR